MIPTSTAARYQGREVVVTGGFGFIGLNLVTALTSAGCRVRVLSRSWPPTIESAPLDGVDFVKGDIRDEVAVRDGIQGAEVIFNLAGKSGPTASNLSPLDDLDVNCRGQLTLLEACREVAPTAVLVFPSSRLVYAPTKQLPVPEDAPTRPLSMYGIHKLTAEDYHVLYRRLYGLRYVILRITNPYGHFQRPEQNRYGIINWFIHLAMQGQDLTVYGDGGQLRDYVHVSDVVEALLLAGTAAAAEGEILNVGGARPIALAEMAEMVVRTAGQGRVVHVPWPDDARRVETGDFVADISRIGRLLGWHPAVELSAGIHDMVSSRRQVAFPS